MDNVKPENPAIQSSVESAPSASHDIGSPTKGAIKAAKMIAGAIIAGYENRTPVSTKDIAGIIDRESGLPELEANQLFPADGMWLVAYKQDHQASRMTKLGDVPNPVGLASIARHTQAIANAVNKCWRLYMEKGNQSPMEVAEAIVMEIHQAELELSPSDSTTPEKG